MSIIFGIDSRFRDRSADGTADSPSNFVVNGRQVSTWNVDSKETLCTRPHRGVTGSCVSSVRLLRLTIPYIPSIVDANPYLCVSFTNTPDNIPNNAINTIGGTLPTATFICTLDSVQTPEPVVRINSTNNMLDFVRGILTYAITVPVGSYTLPALADQIEVLMNEAAAVTTMTVDYGTTSAIRFSIRETAAVGAFNILWNTGVNVATTIAGVIGYDAAADDIGVSPATHTSDDYVTPWITGGDGARWAHYKSDIIQVMPFSPKRTPVVFRVFDPNNVTIPIQDTTPPTAISPLQQVSAVFTVTPYIQDGAYDNQRASMRVM
uniref:Uncharacterized protein n=1 Tax=viral metagenome TaxID=1070528 RepID=A0A6C0LYS1_9ZZZZ